RREWGGGGGGARGGLGRGRAKGGGTAAAVSRKKSPRPMARPVGGNQSHRPSHETARNKPMTVAIDASAGHNRSQKIVQRARLSARVSASALARSCAESGSGVAASAGRAGKPISRKKNLLILTCHPTPANRQKEGI